MKSSTTLLHQSRLAFATMAAMLLGGVRVATTATPELMPPKAAASPEKPPEKPIDKPADKIKGSLVIVGGALRYGDATVWSRIVELAGGRGARIAVFPTASGNPANAARNVIAALKNVGGDPFLVPVTVRSPRNPGTAIAGGASGPGSEKPAVDKVDKAVNQGIGSPMKESSDAKIIPAKLTTSDPAAGDTIQISYQQAVVDPDLVAQVKSAGGVFFTGGEQKRITQALYSADGKNTPMLDAVWDVYRKGGVVAGTSAGAAVMSRIMCRDAKSVLATMHNGVQMGKEIDRGLGFLDAGWYVDQHCFVRGRFARALVMMQSQGFKFGIGIDENTALVVREGEDASVIGYKGALVMDLSEAKIDPNAGGFNLKNAKLTYVDRGDSFNLKTLKLTPSPEKLSEPKIDPNAPNFKPEGDKEIFTNDILGNTTAIDLLAKLIRNKYAESIGLAFDGRVARQQPAPGFEFRFYRQSDSVGWYTGAYGAEDYTVANIHLDIRPITIAGPLYK